MTVERLKKKVLVGIRLDGHAKELLDWALVKVADPGDNVLAIHVCRNSGYLSKDRNVVYDYLEDYKGLCSQKQVALSIEVLRGNSIRKALVRAAKISNISAVIVGITKHCSLGGWLSVAKYCAKRLPEAIDVMAVHNGKIVFSRSSIIQSEVRVLDPRPSIHTIDNINNASRDNYSEFGESEISRLSFDGRDGTMSSKDDSLSTPTVRKCKRGSLSSISLPPEDFTKQRPGWPLLQTNSLVSQTSLEARNMSVVQWVMSLPHRPLSEISGYSYGRDNGKLEELKPANLPKDLEAILMRGSSRHCEVFCFDVLKKSTSGFSSGNLIGKGGCNSVYKGILPQGKPVAVKILESSKESWKEFIQEVDIMTTLKHKGISPLLGICVEDNNLISVYGYISRGTLDDNLHGEMKRKSVMNWEARFHIAVGIAEALNYLHNESPRPVIHRDVKSSNILLTDELEPMLSDFGLAIWAPTAEKSFLNDGDVVGTFGYLAPEYFMYGKVSDKIDVYAFGVVLLELISGKTPIGMEMKKGHESLVMWAKPKLQSGDLNSMLDPALNEDTDKAQLRRMAQAAALCLTQAARLRPKISQVLNILVGEECVDASESRNGNNNNDNSIEDDYDDEVYPESSAESHLSVAFLDVNDNSTSFSGGSLDQRSPRSIEDYLKKRWSRASSLE